jgi:hypothetical protein
LGRDAAEVIHKARDGGDEARHDAGRHQISRNGFQIFVF